MEATCNLYKNSLTLFYLLIYKRLYDKPLVNLFIQTLPYT
jgi:hypothetical protein